MQRSLLNSDHTSSRSRDQGVAAPQSDLNSHPSTLNSPRHGFTLIELAIVIGIMGLLVTILVVAIRPGLITAREAAVKTTLLRIGDVIQQRVQAINNLDVSVEAKKLAALNAGLSEQEATFIIKKNLYRQALPQRPQDLWGLDQANDSGGNDDAPFIVGEGWILTAQTNSQVVATAPNYTALSSALLHLALVDGRSVRAIPGGQLYPMPTLIEDGIKANHHREVTVLGGAEAFYDEWDQPLRFYNFPTQLVVAATNTGVAGLSANIRTLLPGLPADTASISRDPLDPTGLLRTDFQTWTTLTYSPAPLTLAPATLTANTYHEPGAFYLPVLVSAGPDQELGIVEPYGYDPLTKTVLPASQRGWPVALFPVGSFAGGATEQQEWLLKLSDNITSQQR